MNKVFKFLNEIVDEKIIVGYNAAIISNSIVETNTYGAKDIYDTPLSKDALYDIASLTKMFVSVRVMELIQDNTISLDTKVQDILPDFQNNEITIRHLLLHRSGMAASHHGRYTMNKEEMIESMMRLEDLENEVDTIMIYSCINYLIIGLIIEKLDNLSLDTSLQKYVFNPLKLQDTGYNPTDIERCVPTEIHPERGMVQGIVHDSTAYNFGRVAGNAGIFSTLEDMIRFTQSFIQPSLLTKKTIQLLQDTNIDSRSLGWNRFEYNEKSYLYHTGFSGTSILLDLEHQRAFILLTNRVHPKRDNPVFLEKRKEAFRIFLDENK